MYDRSKTVGASDAVHIQAGDWAQLYDRKTSKQPTTTPEKGLAARIGHELEELNRSLFVEATNSMIEVEPYWQARPFYLGNFSNQPPNLEWYTYLPDGLLEDEHTNWIIPFEAKAINMMWRSFNLIRKYEPQLQHAMRVMSAPYCYLSVIYLNTKFEYYKIKYDPPYADALFEKEKLFHWHLTEGIRPPEYKGKRKGWI